MSRYFVSYSRADSDFVLRLVEDLRTAGVDVWLDQFDILPSQRWDRALEAALRACAGVLVILSPRSVASENVMDEVSFALDQRKDVIPVLFEKCELPLRISRVQHIDFTRDYRAALERCKAALSGRPPQPEPVREETKADKPAPAPRRCDAEDIQSAERDLTVYVGPIAKKLVETAAMRASNKTELYRLLADRIGEAADRAAFLKRAPDPVPDSAGAAQSGAAGAERGSMAVSTAPRFDRTLLDRIIPELAMYLGPISRHLVEQASREAADIDALYERLASRIPESGQRSAFLKRVRGLR